MCDPFEYPFVGIGIGLLVFIGFWIFGAIKPEKKKRWHYLVPVVICIAAFALAYFVQTDNEKIFNNVNKGIKAFQDKQIEPIKEIIADDYADSLHSSKELILAYCQGLFETAAAEKITFFSRQTDIKDDKAVFTFEAMVKFAEQSRIAQMGKPVLIVKARLHFKKTRSKKWLIVSSAILELDRNPVNWNEMPKSM